MNNNAHKLYTLRRKFSAAGFCALTILIIVVSCPLKRMLQNNVASFTSIQKCDRITTNHTASAHYTKSVYCCASQRKTLFVNAGFTLRQFVSPFYLPGDQNGSSFEIAYLLSRIKRQSDYAIVLKISSFPLFLQHRRLLI